MRNLFGAALLIMTSAWMPSSAQAAPCAGFIDVDDSSGFCPNVEWLKNRAITLGCSTPNSYCPLEPVIRLSMAAFMNRLGTAMTPAVLYDDATGGTLLLDTPPDTICETPAFSTGAYPRAAQLSASLTVQTNATAASLELRLVQSVDNGPWTSLNSVPTSVSGVNRRVNASALRGALSLQTNTSYRFGLAVTRAAGSGTTGNPIAWTCQIKAIVTSRTGAASPF
jgi:hypothetical protein